MRKLLLAVIILIPVKAYCFTQDEVDILGIEDVDGTTNIVIQTKVFGCVSKFTLPKSQMKRVDVLDSIAEKSVERANNGCK